MSHPAFFHNPFDDKPTWQRRTPDEHRREAMATLKDLYADDSDSASARYWRERANWTDEQWEAHDAEIEARIKTEDEEKERQARQNHRYRLAKDGWPKRALDAAEAADGEHPAIKRVSEWSQDRSNNILVLSGVPGSGKTTAAARWALVLRFDMKRDRRTTFVRASTFARTSRYDAQRDLWLGAPTLVLDDLGAEFADAKGSLQTDLDELIDVFYSERKRLIITTNLTSAQFKTRYGERIADRLRECGTWFGVASESLRGKAK